jgi:hypothetical protein
VAQLPQDTQREIIKASRAEKTARKNGQKAPKAPKTTKTPKAPKTPASSLEAQWNIFLPQFRVLLSLISEWKEDGSISRRILEATISAGFAKPVKSK